MRPSRVVTSLDAAAARSPSAARSLARPKSSSFTSPPSPIITFSGFTSRWITPASCAAARPRAIPRAIRAASASGSLAPAACITARSERPVTRSMAMNTSPPISPTSNTAAMFGWLTARNPARSRQSRSLKIEKTSAASSSSRWNVTKKP